MESMTIMTASPDDAASPMSVSAPPVLWLTIGVAAPANIRMSVPINSAPTYFIVTYSFIILKLGQKWTRTQDLCSEQTFLAREMGGEGNEHGRGGKGPSSNDHDSTLKHLQLLLRREGCLLFPFLKPPKRGAPGVPGVTGVEGADAPSSPSICVLVCFGWSEETRKVKKCVLLHVVML